MDYILLIFILKDQDPDQGQLIQHLQPEKDLLQEIQLVQGNPHLARGDSYKSTHEEEPSKYELPADLAQGS